MRTRVVVTAVAALLMMASAAEAQRSGRGYGSRQGPQLAGNVSFGVVGATPIGDLGSFFDAGFGAQFSGAVAVGAEGRVRLRGQLGFLNYGIERQQFCFSLPIGCRVDLDLTTTNNIFFGSVGPEVAFPQGRFEPYVHVGGGFAAFVTSSSLDDGYDHGRDFGSTTHLSDAVLSWTAGGGIRIRLSEGRKPVSLDLGVDRQENGVAEFLTEGDIIDHPDGSITVFPNRSAANLMTFRVGISIGIPHKGDRRRR